MENLSYKRTEMGSEWRVFNIYIEISMEWLFECSPVHVLFFRA